MLVPKLHHQAAQQSICQVLGVTDCSAFSVVPMHCSASLQSVPFWRCGYTTIPYHFSLWRVHNSIKLPPHFLWCYLL